ncbi:hypothetical protein GCM10029964_039570 [Kibdelosporangium lantanae]
MNLDDREALVFQQVSRNSVLSKIILTSFVGALTFGVTNMLFDSIAAQFGTAVGAGAIILVIQFLVDFEQRLGAVEDSQVEQTRDIRRAVDDGFTKVGPATRLYAELEDAGLDMGRVSRLVAHAAAVKSRPVPLVSALMQSEVERVVRLIGSLRDDNASYDGEDRDLLLALTGNVRTSIDAISTPMVDAGRKPFQGGFWNTDLGHRYLNLQREAILRQVRIRRIFVVRGPDTIEALGMRSVLASQADLGIDVRALYLADMTNFLKTYLHDFILFDDVLSYDVIPETPVDEEGPLLVHTKLVTHPVNVRERREHFDKLWDAAAPFAPAAGTEVEDSSPSGRP